MRTTTFHRLEKSEYESTGKFIFRFDLDRMLPALKAEHDWLEEAPACALQRIAWNLDMALKLSFKAGAGFPRFKNRFGRRSFYLANAAVHFKDKGLILPKLGRVRPLDRTKNQELLTNESINPFSCGTQPGVLTFPSGGPK